MSIENLTTLLKKSISDGIFIVATLSGQKDKQSPTSKITVKPFTNTNETLYQFSFFNGQKVVHKNMNATDTENEIARLLPSFKQLALFTAEADYQIFSNNDGSCKIVKNKATKVKVNIASHNRTKKYIIEDGVYCDFLHKLGVMDTQGKVYKNKYDKFRQINKYLEILDSSLDELDTKKTLTIVDFGSGKAYLTFALYWYLTQKRQLSVKITGLDIKDDVIAHCNALAHELNYEYLVFEKITIKDYHGTDMVDVAIALHACDTATDDAIVKALDWNARYIFLVPCCQHEFFPMIKNDALQPMLTHGIIKERLSSLVTDTVRGMILEIFGYAVEIFEFIDMEHTPKNILIRARKTAKPAKNALQNYEAFKNFWQLEPYLEKCLHNQIDTIRARQQ